jgi:hypothetical protein
LTYVNIGAMRCDRHCDEHPCARRAGDKFHQGASKPKRLSAQALFFRRSAQQRL